MALVSQTHRELHHQMMEALGDALPPRLRMSFPEYLSVAQAVTEVAVAHGATDDLVVDRGTFVAHVEDVRPGEWVLVPVGGTVEFEQVAARVVDGERVWLSLDGMAIEGFEVGFVVVVAPYPVAHEWNRSHSDVQVKGPGL